MKKSIDRIDPMSAAKITGILYAAVGAILLPLFLVISLFDDGFGFGSAFTGLVTGIAVMVFYGILGFIGAALMVWLYNTFASRVGGIEVEVSDEA